MYGSTDHYALRLRKWKLTTKQTVVISCVIGTVLGLSGIGMMLSPTNGVCLTILLTLIGIALVAGFLLSKVDMTR
jgi:hypothetical protein